MSRHRWLPFIALSALLPATALATPPATDLGGLYRSGRTGMVLTVGVCDGDRLCGRLVALGDLPPLDANNPVLALQTRRLCGTIVLDHLEWENGNWRGIFYDPQNGTDYTINIAPAERGAVRVTGHSGRAVLSRTYSRAFEVWEHVAPPDTPCDAAALTS